jgi:hypothetical protein
MIKELFDFSSITDDMYDAGDIANPSMRFMFKSIPESRGSREEFTLQTTPNTEVFNAVVDETTGNVTPQSINLALNEEIS